MRFRLRQTDDMGNKTGKHCMGTPTKGNHFPTIIKPGQIVESDQPLDQIFHNKFERLPDESEPEPQQAKGKKQAKRE